MTLGCCADGDGKVEPAPKPDTDYPTQEDSAYGSTPKKDAYTKKPGYPEQEDAAYGKRDAAYGKKPSYPEEDAAYGSKRDAAYGKKPPSYREDLLSNKPRYEQQQPKQRYPEEPSSKPGYDSVPEQPGSSGYKLPKWKREEPEYKKYDYKGRDQRLLDAYKELQQSMYGPGAGGADKRRHDYEPGAGLTKPGYGNHQYDEDSLLHKPKGADYGSSNLKKGGLLLPPLLDELDTSSSKDRYYKQQQQQPYGGGEKQQQGYGGSSSSGQKRSSYEEEMLDKYRKEYEALKRQYPSAGAREQEEEEKYSHRMREHYSLEHEYHHKEEADNPKKAADQRPKMDFLDSVLKKDGIKKPDLVYPAPKNEIDSPFKEYDSRYGAGDSDGADADAAYPEQPVVRYDPDEYADDGPEPEQPKKNYNYIDQVNYDRQAAKERLAKRILENPGAAKSPHVRGPIYQQQKTQAKEAPKPLPVSGPAPSANKPVTETPKAVQKPLQLPNKVVNAPISSGLAGKKITELPIFDAYRVKSDAERWQDRALEQLVRKDANPAASGSQELQLEFDEGDEEPQQATSSQPKAEPVPAAAEKKEEAKPPVAEQPKAPETPKPAAEQPKAEPVPAAKKEEEAKPVAAQPQPQEQKPAAQPAPQKEAEKKPAADAAPKVPAAEQKLAEQPKLDAKVTLPVLAKVAEQQPAAAPVAAAVQAAQPTEVKPAVASTSAASAAAPVQAATASTGPATVAAAVAAAAPASQPAVAATASQQQAAKAA
jgi:hypothetical protein